MGTLKGKIAITVFKCYPLLRQTPYLGNLFLFFKLEDICKYGWTM